MNKWTESTKLGRWFSGRVSFFYANWITSLGSVIALVATALLLSAMVFHIIAMLTDRPTNAYVDMVTFMLLPMLLIFGFVVVGVGALVERRRRGRGERKTVAIDIGGPEFVRKAMGVGFVAVIALILFASFGYEAYHYTDSSEFCMKVCHSVMEPEGVAYERSPHANVACVKCHIGPGADWFVKAKLSGLRQVVAVMRDSYQRPIPAPVHNLRPARQTCEGCHDPGQFHGSELIVRQHVESDAENSPSVSALVLKVGGKPQPGIRATGVHWHVDEANEVRYRAVDEKRQKIVEVIQKTPEGEVRYLSDDADEYEGVGEWRVMDCIDCHNRPTHIFEVPHRALDDAFTDGLLPDTVPWLREAAERALYEVQPDEDTVQAMAAFLQAVYDEEHPEDVAALAPELDGVAALLAEILERNVYPDMGIVWGTYPNHIGHVDTEGEMSEAAGCFRCHDDMHESEDGRVISQDCDACHTIVAEREVDLESLPDYVQAVLNQ